MLPFSLGPSRMAGEDPRCTQFNQTQSGGGFAGDGTAPVDSIKIHWVAQGIDGSTRNWDIVEDMRILGSESAKHPSQIQRPKLRLELTILPYS